MMRRKGVIIFCLCLCLFAGLASADENSLTAGSSGYGSVSVISYPPGGAIYLDGIYRNITPGGIDHIEAGFHTVEVRLAGYKVFSYVAQVANGTTEQIVVNLELATSENASSARPAIPGFGSVAVDSVPGGAAVILDGSPAGLTPAAGAALILNNVSSGNHTITVELSGYQPFTMTTAVIKNQVSRVKADFLNNQSSSGAVTVIPAPAGQGAKAGISPMMAFVAVGLLVIISIFRRR